MTMCMVLFRCGDEATLGCCARRTHPPSYSSSDAKRGAGLFWFAYGWARARIDGFFLWGRRRVARHVSGFGVWMQRPQWSVGGRGVISLQRARYSWSILPVGSLTARPDVRPTPGWQNFCVSPEARNRVPNGTVRTLWHSARCHPQSAAGAQRRTQRCTVRPLSLSPIPQLEHLPPTRRLKHVCTPGLLWPPPWTYDSKSANLKGHLTTAARTGTP